MVRPLRIEYYGAYYHVTCRGNERKNIFTDDRDREKFLKILKESVRIFNVEVYCYVLMSNHFHLLLHTPEGNLQRFMQRFNTAYTTYYNKRHKRNGHLLQGRYKGLLVEADEYLLGLSRYIHLNPVKLKKYKNVEAEEKKKMIKEYRWSSYLGYTSYTLKEDFITYDIILGYMGSTGNARSRKQYIKFVYDGINDDLSNIYDEVKGQVVLGGDDFLEWVQKEFLEGKEIKEKDYSKIKELKRNVDLEKIVKGVAKEYGVDACEILKKRSVHSEARHVLLELSYRYNLGRISLRELGRELGGIGGDSIVQTHKRVHNKLNKDKALLTRIERIERALLSQ